MGDVLMIESFFGWFFARGPGASPTLQPRAILEIEVRDTVWQVPDIACVPVFRCIVMSRGVVRTRACEKVGAKKGPDSCEGSQGEALRPHRSTHESCGASPHLPFRFV